MDANETDLMSGAPRETPETPKPYTTFVAICPVRKNHTPVLGTFGASIDMFVIMPAEDWRRMLREHPSLQNAHFNIAEL